MATDNLKAIEGFVLREIKYKETSKIIEVFTKDLGRISIIANSVEKKNRENLASTLRFTKSRYELRKSRDMYYLKNSDLLNGYKKSFKNFDIIVYKSVISDLLLRTIDEIDREYVFRLLDNTYEAFEKSDCKFSYIFLSFLLKYISFIGFKPNFDYCTSCQKDIREFESLYFSANAGGVICTNCREYYKDRIKVDIKDIIDLKRLLYTASSQIHLIAKIDKPSKLYNIIIEYLLNKLELKKFSSLNWAKKLFES
ncbi:MAG: DNA repair protein RecO [Tissierellia bacterium]|nr:DNA repair protein RecO [Tissierellia bacterium]